MTFRVFSTGILILSVFALPSRGALLISEVVFNEVGSDVSGEWIEVFNTGPDAIDLTNHKIGDEETKNGTGATEALYQFPSGASIAPGQIQIVAVSAATFLTNYGILPTYESSSTNASVPDMAIYAGWDPDGGQINMSNTNDQAVIVGPLDTILDAASWGDSTFAFNPSLGAAADGQSYERINPYVDTNTAADWQPGPNPSGSTANQRSTPFSVPNVPEPTVASLAIAWALALFVGYRPKRGY